MKMPCQPEFQVFEEALTSRSGVDIAVLHLYMLQRQPPYLEV
jgi:hypothetical protein